MIRIKLTLLVSVLTFLSMDSIHAGSLGKHKKSEWVRLYYHSPIHLRQEIISHQISESPIPTSHQELIEATGDHSFDGLFVEHPLLKQLLTSQVQARKKWKEGPTGQAFSEFIQLAEHFIEIGSLTEAAFSYHAAAEISAENENYPACLDYLSRASGLIDFRRYPYFEAHYFESLGYALWFLDEFPRSIDAFSQAAKRWHRIRFSPGIIACWNNMASLYEELQLFQQAESCYQKALEMAESADLESHGLAVIRQQVRINFALFSKKMGDTVRASRLINRCRFRTESEKIELELAKARVFDDLDLCRKVQATRPSQIIEKELLLARLLIERSRYEEAEQSAQSALYISRKNHLLYYARKTLHLLGLIYERQGRFQSAIDFFSRAVSDPEEESNPSFPFKRAYSDAFNGWIRCLIRLGRQSQARQLIHQNTRRSGKPEKDSKIRPSRSPHRAIRPVKSAFHGKHPDPVPDSDYTIIELWPNHNQVYAWLESSQSFRFIQISLSESITDLILRVLAPMYRAEQTLPITPDNSAIAKLKKELLIPLKHLVNSRRVVLIPHKILQIFPFEILTFTGSPDEFSQWIISYLPIFDNQLRPQEIFSGPPFVFLPESFSSRSGAMLESEFFSRTFPGSHLTSSFEELEKQEARWIHFSSHLEWNPFFWKASRIHHDEGIMELVRLFRKDFRCSLLSLGVCDAGNGFDGITPYWLGLSEGFLYSGAQTLLISRWKMDELSSYLFVGFFKRIRKGIPMDRALHEARREFMLLTLTRGDFSQSAKHPFFWAGVSYVGWPGLQLYPAKGPPGWRVLFLLSVLLLVSSILWRIS